MRTGEGSVLSAVHHVSWGRCVSEGLKFTLNLQEQVSLNEAKRNLHDRIRL